jgi:hypothetical protein
MIGNIFKTSFWNLFYDTIPADSNNYNKYTHNDQLILEQSRKGQCHEISKIVIFHSLDLLIMVHIPYSRTFLFYSEMMTFTLCLTKQEILKNVSLYISTYKF